MTEYWQNQRQEQEQNEQSGMLYVKVMTDDQMELLRQQICVYATICEQLVEMHKSFSAKQDLVGMSLGNLYCDPLMAAAAHKIPARQRWNPTSVQLQILERIFKEGNGNPSKQEIKEITTELTQHGQISETNVYNWFQNRRARSKRKQSVPVPNNAESEVEPEVEFTKEKASATENTQSFENSSAPREKNIYFQSPEIGAEMLCLDAQSDQGKPVFPSYCDLRSPGVDQLIGKMEVPENHIPYWEGEGPDGYEMVGM